jgi:hypothetical protein
VNFLAAILQSFEWRLKTVFLAGVEGHEFGGKKAISKRHSSWF